MAGRLDRYRLTMVRPSVVRCRAGQATLLILPDRVVRNWWRQDGHALVLEDLAEVLDSAWQCHDS
jgi:uncharacterized protein